MDVNRRADEILHEELKIRPTTLFAILFGFERMLLEILHEMWQEQNEIVVPDVKYLLEGVCRGFRELLFIQTEDRFTHIEAATEAMLFLYGMNENCHLAWVKYYDRFTYRYFIENFSTAFLEKLRIKSEERNQSIRDSIESGLEIQITTNELRRLMGVFAMTIRLFSKDREYEEFLSKSRIATNIVRQQLSELVLSIDDKTIM